MKLLIACFLAVVISTTGVILCDDGSLAKMIFQFGFFGSLGTSFVLLLLGQFN